LVVEISALTGGALTFGLLWAFDLKGAWAMATLGVFGLLIGAVLSSWVRGWDAAERVSAGVIAAAAGGAGMALGARLPAWRWLIPVARLAGLAYVVGALSAAVWAVDGLAVRLAGAVGVAALPLILAVQIRFLDPGEVRPAFFAAAWVLTGANLLAAGHMLV
jgi:hypothetical protein